VSGRKRVTGSGDALFQEFSAATRQQSADLSSSRDMALGFVTLAILQKSDGDQIDRIVLYQIG
jgi:hypothetical protein